MSETIVLLKAYFEALHSILEDKRDILAENIKGELSKEIKNRGYEGVNQEKFAAYWEACLAFIEERIEAYNPFGIQYTFDQNRRKEAFELELQLDWYDSRAEFENLVEAARRKAHAGNVEEGLELLAEELIKEIGAFPDKTIISAYEAKPGLRKLPDYIAARTIEEIIR